MQEYMIVLAHNTGMTVDIVIVDELGGESVQNTSLIGWWATEELYRNTVQAQTESKVGY